MTDRNLDLTAQENSALEQDKLTMGLVKEANASQPVTIASIFPDAIPMSTLQYWSAIQRSDALAHLKQAIAAGDNVNEHNGDGYTALHSAAENGCTGNVKLLLGNGADTTIRTSSGKSAADLARQQGYEMIATLRETAAISQPERR
ncbi:ankyrin repeat domain-containing protein [Chromobacterium phragmitis]|uniref:ankyrin repeat domain-containing protein n=1 Tax=Chromobacterium phragmitis TaxID=2202141 RepID=UPI00143CF90D|nr:ankyrin repeat domain-containing protein [Chromobacterium phragmitis]